MKLTLDLNNPRYTPLHRAGVAGLAMSLMGCQITGLLWQLTPFSITLSWEGSDHDALEALFRTAFQLSENGLIYLPGLGLTNNSAEQYLVHEGLLGTFLQHNKFVKALGVQQVNLDFEDDQPRVFKYKALSWYITQSFWQEVVDREGNLIDGLVPVASWLYPGATARHASLGQVTAHRELAVDALVLAFAPIGCCYYRLRSQFHGKQAQYALVVPEVKNLESYAQARQGGYRIRAYGDLWATGASDAGLRFLLWGMGQKVSDSFGVRGCEVVTFGNVAWNSQQKTRTAVTPVMLADRVHQIYQLCKDSFPNKTVTLPSGEVFYPGSLARELVTENLAAGRYWFAGLARLSSDQWKQLLFERQGVKQMIGKVTWDDEIEQRLVDAVQQALARHYAKVAKSVQFESHPDSYQARLSAAFSRAFTSLRSEILRCKSGESFGHFLSQFLTSQGSVSAVQGYERRLLALASNSQTWQKAQDLALMAMAGYQGRQQPGGNEPDVEPEEEGEELEFSLS